MEASLGMTTEEASLIVLRGLCEKHGALAIASFPKRRATLDKSIGSIVAKAGASDTRFRQWETHQSAISNSLVSKWRALGILQGDQKIKWNQEKMKTFLKSSALAVVPSQTVEMQTTSFATIVDTAAKLEQAAKYLKDGSLQGRIHMTLYCGGTSDDLHLVAIKTHTQCLILDCVKLGAPSTCSLLETILQDGNIIKMFHDASKNGKMLRSHGRIPLIHGVIDSQLVMELLVGDLWSDPSKMLRHFNVSGGWAHGLESAQILQGPLPPSAFNQAAKNVLRLWETRIALDNELGERFV